MIIFEQVGDLVEEAKINYFKRTRPIQYINLRILIKASESKLFNKKLNILPEIENFQKDLLDIEGMAEFWAASNTLAKANWVDFSGNLSMPLRKYIMSLFTEKNFSLAKLQTSAADMLGDAQRKRKATVECKLKDCHAIAKTATLPDIKDTYEKILRCEFSPLN